MRCHIGNAHFLLFCSLFFSFGKYKLNGKVNKKNNWVKRKIDQYWFKYLQQIDMFIILWLDFSKYLFIGTFPPIFTFVDYTLVTFERDSFRLVLLTEYFHIYLIIWEASGIIIYTLWPMIFYVESNDIEWYFIANRPFETLY